MEEVEIVEVVDTKGTKPSYLPQPSATPLFSSNPPSSEQQNNEQPLFVGIDIGSMTAKLCVLDIKVSPTTPIFEFYRRHKGDVLSTLKEALNEATPFLKGRFVVATVSGSAGMQVSSAVGLPFVQEVVSCGLAASEICGGVNVAIELGGEDAKILRFNAANGLLKEALMNTQCSAGTGAFLDQMASLLNTDTLGLDTLASKHEKIYPIASRCGVFAKSDIQPLLSEGARKEDIAASVLQAVVNQTIGGLAGGKPINGRVALLGGPLHYLQQLRVAFTKTLNLPEECIISPKHSHLLVSIGAALFSAGHGNSQTDGGCGGTDNNHNQNKFSHIPMPAEFLIHRLAKLDLSAASAFGLSKAVPRLNPLFESEEQLEQFRNRHSESTAKRSDISKHHGPTFLGVDAGSTTIKLVLIDSDGRILHSFYAAHQGQMLKMAIDAVLETQKLLQPDAWIARSCCTGYGEFLLKTALRAEESIVETVAHVRAARFFSPEADFVLDIGGQDMKCVTLDKQGVVRDISLNESCSSGCGSFIATLSDSLGITVEQFAKAGLRSRSPLDLGTRCTVFVNSRIKQAQKDGATIEDLSAGMALSVVRNALFKVVRLTSVENLRDSHIVVQGGSFANDSVLRAIEVVLQRNVIRPDVAGLMGALGSALTAKQSWINKDDSNLHSSVLPSEVLEKLTWESSTRHCGRCINNCSINVHKFSSGACHISGNRCERGAEESAILTASAQTEPLPNLFKWQRERVFKYKPLKTEEAKRGQIGIPRALTFADNFQFWAACLGSLGFQVLLSSETTEKLFDSGSHTLTVESACLPSKTVHGHILNLIERKLPYIFLPCIPHTIDKPMPKSGERNQYNCPLANSYAYVIKNACGFIGNDEQTTSTSTTMSSTKLISAAFPLHDKDALIRRLKEEISKFSSPEPTTKECEIAVNAGFVAMEQYFREVAEKGNETLAFMERTKTPGCVIACRPYHLDPYLANNVPNLVALAGRCILTVESVMHLCSKESLPNGFPELDVYSYDGRIIRSAIWASRQPGMAFIHLLSFGCGIAPNTDDGIKKVMEEANHPFATIKLDQKSTIGSVRVRVRSLFAVMDARNNQMLKEKAPLTTEPNTSTSSVPPPIQQSCHVSQNELLLYNVKTKGSQMRRDRTILVWPFSEEHAELWARGFASNGQKVALFPTIRPQDCYEFAMRYAHPDLCYGGWLLIGMFIWCFKKGGFDPDKTDVLWQTWGGECTAGWLAYVLKRALVSAGLPQVEVTSISYSGLVDPGLGRIQGMRCNAGVCLSELMQTVLYRTRPYEKVPGSVNALYKKWMERLGDFVQSGNLLHFSKVCSEVVADFDAIPLVTEEHTKPRIGFAGTMGKADAYSYNLLIDYLEKEENCEIVALDLMDYSIIGSMNEKSNKRYLSSSVGRGIGGKVAKFMVEMFRNPMAEALSKSKRFTAPLPIEESHKRTLEFISPSHHGGEGWVMTWHILHFLEQGINNVLCFISFQCVSVHIGCRGVLPSIQKKYPNANVAVIDFDSGTAFVNQLNRIKLMLGCIPGRKRLDSKIVCQTTDIEDFGHKACSSCSASTSCSVHKSKSEI